MADETTRSNFNDPLLNAEIEARVRDAARAASVMRNLVHVAQAPSGMGPAPIARTFASWPKLTAASVNDGSALSNSAVSTGGVTITAATVGVKLFVTDQARITSIFGLADEETWQRQLGLALADKLDSDLATLLGGFNSTVGSSGIDLTLANFLSAIYTLDVADAPNGNPSDSGSTFSGPFPSGLQGKVAVLHPIQVSDLRSAVSNASSAWLSDPTAAQVLFSGGAPAAGFIGSLYGVPVFQSTNVDTANGGNDRAGAMFVPSALGAYIIYEGRVEYRREPDYLSEMIVGSSYYGTAELVDAYGVSIITDA